MGNHQSQSTRKELGKKLDDSRKARELQYRKKLSRESKRRRFLLPAAFYFLLAVASLLLGLAALASKKSDWFPFAVAGIGAGMFYLANRSIRAPYWAAVRMLWAFLGWLALYFLWVSIQLGAIGLTYIRWEVWTLFVGVFLALLLCLWYAQRLHRLHFEPFNEEILDQNL